MAPRKKTNNNNLVRQLYQKSIFLTRPTDRPTASRRSQTFFNRPADLTTRSDGGASCLHFLDFDFFSLHSVELRSQEKAIASRTLKGQKGMHIVYIKKWWTCHQCPAWKYLQYLKIEERGNYRKNGKTCAGSVTDLTSEPTKRTVEKRTRVILGEFCYFLFWFFRISFFLLGHRKKKMEGIPLSINRSGCLISKIQLWTTSIQSEYNVGKKKKPPLLVELQLSESIIDVTVRIETLFLLPPPLPPPPTHTDTQIENRIFLSLFVFSETINRKRD